MGRHSRRPIPRPRWLWRSRGLPIGDDLLRNGDVWIGRRETSGGIQQTLSNADRRDEDPVRPGLRHHGVRLHTIENFLPFQRCLPNLIRCCRRA